jgi:hypothetical protein
MAVENVTTCSLLKAYEVGSLSFLGDEVGEQNYRTYLWWIQSSPQEKENFLKSGYKHEFRYVRIVFDMTVGVVITNKVDFYYRDLHTAEKSLRLVSEETFLKDSTLLYHGGGELKHEDGGGFRAIGLLDSHILQIFKKKQYQNTFFDHTIHTNEKTQQIEKILNYLFINKNLIKSLYQKDYNKMTVKELQDFCVKGLKEAIKDDRATDILSLIKDDPKPTKG